MTPEQAAARLNRIANRLERECVRAVNTTAAKGVALGRSLSKGALSLATLRRMGHPYAVRDPRPPGPAYIINAQTGRFLAAWQARPASAFASVIRGAVENRSPEAGFLNGRNRPKSRMIRRPIGDEVEDRLRPVFFNAVLQAVRRAKSQK